MSSSLSCVLSFTISLTLFAGMQMFKQQLASTEYMTIVGGLIGSLVFLFVLTVSFFTHLSKMSKVFITPETEMQFLPILGLGVNIKFLS